jgi:hypothetical protein
MGAKDFRVSRDGVPTTHLDAPSEADGKPNFVPVPFTQGLYMFVSHKGDDLTGGVLTRGGGQVLRINFTQSSSATDEAVATFYECVEMHDGHIDYDPSEWDWDDLWSVVVRIPKTPVTFNSGGTGNANIAAAASFPAWDSGTTYSAGDMVIDGGIAYVATQGSTNQQPNPAVSTYWQYIYNVIVPAAGDGYFNVDLDEAIAVPYEGGGYWDYDPWDDEFAASSTPGYADWMLFDFAQSDVALLKNMPCSSQRGFFELDAFKVEPLYARWQFVLNVTRHDVGTRGNATIGGYYTCFREDTT